MRQCTGLKVAMPRGSEDGGLVEGVGPARGDEVFWLAAVGRGARRVMPEQYSMRSMRAIVVDAGGCRRGGLQVVGCRDSETVRDRRALVALPRGVRGCRP